MKIRLVDYAHAQLTKFVKPGDSTIDATVGNGHDSVFLAELVGPKGKVFGFDLQELAIETASTVLKTKKLIPQVDLQVKGHELMLQSIPGSYVGQVSATMFNLGYLPLGDKSVITIPDTTIQALDQSVQLLKESGVISILAYRGHDGGEEEYESVKAWISRKKELAAIDYKDSEHSKKRGPYFWLLQKQPITQ